MLRETFRCIWEVGEAIQRSLFRGRSDLCCLGSGCFFYMLGSGMQIDTQDALRSNESDVGFLCFCIPSASVRGGGRFFSFLLSRGPIIEKLVDVILTI